MKRVAMNYVHGSVACKPDCSRYRNENERIIVFPHKDLKAFSDSGTAQRLRVSDLTVLRNSDSRQPLSDWDLFVADITSLAHVIDDVRSLHIRDIQGVSGTAREQKFAKIAGVMASVAMCASLLALVW